MNATSVVPKVLIITNLPSSASPDDIVTLFRDKSSIELGPGDLKIIPNKKRGGFSAIVKVPEAEAEKAASETRGTDIRGNTIRVRVDVPKTKPATVESDQAPPDSTVVIPSSPAGTSPQPIVTPPGAQVIMPATAPATTPIATAAGIMAGTVQAVQQPTVIIPPTPTVRKIEVPEGTPLPSTLEKEKNVATEEDLQVKIDQPRDPGVDGKFAIGIQTVRSGKATKSGFSVSSASDVSFSSPKGDKIEAFEQQSTDDRGRAFIRVKIVDLDALFATIDFDFEDGSRHSVNLSR